MRKTLLLIAASAVLSACGGGDNAKNSGGPLALNDLGYFERQGVNVLIFSNDFNGGFNDEKNSGIEIIHHGVRTVQGGAVRLNNTPEQWDLVPKTVSRTVNKLEEERRAAEAALEAENTSDTADEVPLEITETTNQEI